MKGVGLPLACGFVPAPFEFPSVASDPVLGNENIVSNLFNT